MVCGNWLNPSPAARIGGRSSVQVALVNVMVTGYALKVGYEVIATPLTYLAINWLKRAENSLAHNAVHAEAVIHFDTEVLYC
jgi:uncharacterized PurR-regulated membrane protein YhhQ (DUF165 family)